MIALYCIDHVLDDRRKFRSQTSDNMERWKSRGGNSQRRESVRGKKMQVREKVKKSRNTVFPIILWLRRVDVVLCGRRKGFCTLPKLSKNVRFCSMSKNDGRRGTLGGQGADFLRGVAFWRIRSSGLLRLDDSAWQVQHFVWPGTTFAWQAQNFTQMEWKNRKTH